MRSLLAETLHVQRRAALRATRSDGDAGPGRKAARMKAPNLEQVIEQLIAECVCDSCRRYRKWFAARAAQYAVRIEESLRGGARR
jgi:hypothetical protein